MQHNIAPGIRNQMIQYPQRNVNNYPYQPQTHRQVSLPAPNAIVHQPGSIGALNNTYVTAPIFTPPIPQPAIPQIHNNLTDNVLISSPNPLPVTLNFRKLAFYEQKHEILRPSILTANNVITMPQNVKSSANQEFHFSFVFSCAMASEISLNRDILSNEYVVQAQLRITAIDCVNPDYSDDYDDFLPMGLMVRVNGRPCPLPPCGPSARQNVESRRVARPIALTHLIKASPMNSNHIIINWATEQQRNFVITINLVKKLSAQFLLDKLKEKPKIPVDTTKNTIRKQYKRDIDDDDESTENADDDDIATTVVRASLVCPLSKCRIMYPAKGKNCTHLQCFDGFAFISLNEKKPCWSCPVCNRALYYNDLLLDEYFIDILKNDQLSFDCQEVQLLVDGSWKSYEETGDGNFKSSPNTSPKQTVSGSDGTVFEDREMKSAALVESTDSTAPNAGPVVDLTSDEEFQEEISSSSALDIDSLINEALSDETFLEK